MKSKQAVTVFGAGSWGTAIAKVLAENNWKVNLWAREEQVVDSIKNSRENKLFLPGIKLPRRINPINRSGLSNNFSEIIALRFPSFTK